MNKDIEKLAAEEITESGGGGTYSIDGSTAGSISASTEAVLLKYMGTITSSMSQCKASGMDYSTWFSTVFVKLGFVTTDMCNSATFVWLMPYWNKA